MTGEPSDDFAAEHSAARAEARAAGRGVGAEGAGSAVPDGRSLSVLSDGSPAATPTGPDAPDWPSRARQLQARLAGDGMTLRVEARGALAIVVATSSGWPADPTRRRAIVRAAVDAGFSHVAVELDADPRPPADEHGEATSPAPGDAPRAHHAPA